MPAGAGYGDLIIARHAKSAAGRLAVQELPALRAARPARRRDLNVILGDRVHES
jgi:hypothetical protein